MPPEDDNKKTDEGLKIENEKLQERIKKLEQRNQNRNRGNNRNNQNRNRGRNKDLITKTRDQTRQERKKARLDEKIENSIGFNYGLDDYYEKNKHVLGEDIQKIIKVASDEKYDGHINKARAIKSAIIQSFFEKKENVDLLTPMQKRELDKYQSLVKNRRDEESLRIYSTLFEPVLAMKKEIRRAKELALSKQGYAPTNDVIENYKQRLINQADRVHRKISKTE